MRTPEVLPPYTFVDTLISCSTCRYFAAEQRKLILDALEAYNTFKARFLLFCASKNIQNPNDILERLNRCFHTPQLKHSTNSNNASDEDIFYAHTRMFDQPHSEKIGFIQGAIFLIDALYIELYLHQFYGVETKLFNNLAIKAKSKKPAAYVLEAFAAIKPYYPQDFAVSA